MRRKVTLERGIDVSRYLVLLCVDSKPLIVGTGPIQLHRANRDERTFQLVGDLRFRLVDLLPVPMCIHNLSHAHRVSISTGLYTSSS